MGISGRILVAGSRTIVNYGLVYWVMDNSGFGFKSVISGGADGVDKLGERVAASQGIPVVQYLPDWKTHGKGAGVIRNTEMVNVCDAAIIIWDGRSRGTQDTLMKCIAMGRPTLLYNTSNGTVTRYNH